MPLTFRRSTPRPTLLAALCAAMLLPAAVAAPAPAAATPPGMLLPYTVTTHDLLIGLSRTLFSSPGAWREVSRLNHLADANRIKPGQVLMVPAEYLHNKVVPARLLSAFDDVRNDVTPASGGAAAIDVSATEVLEGQVHAQVGSAAGQSADVPAKFGAPLEPGRKPVVLPLPPAPDLSALPASFARLPIKLHLAGNGPLRVQVANDAAFDHIALDLHVAAGDDIRIPQLADGDWHLRVRRVSPEGLEGLDALRDFRLRARPESPFLLDPPANAKRPVGDIPLHWTHNPDAATYIVEVARDPQFTLLASRDDQVRGEQAVFHPVDTAFGAADGVYWWHVVSVDADGRRGAWGDTQALILRPTPRAPLGRESPDGSGIELSWGGRAEDRAEVELAADAGFQQIVARGDFAATGGKLPRPSSGEYWAHVRFVEPDGFKTAWSGPVKIAIDSNWHKALRALLP